MALPAIYTDETAAREHLEKLLWPECPICPHCGNSHPDRITKLQGQSTRPGVYKCNECEKPFSVTVGTLFERSHIKLHVWLYAVHLLTSSKKGLSAHQLHRMIGVTYKTAWFMWHRIREGMKSVNPSPMGGKGRTVEVDETYFGRLKGMPKAHAGWGHKNIVMTLVERGGAARSFHMEGTTIAAIMPILRASVTLSTLMMTDEARYYNDIRVEYARHDKVNHKLEEYVRYEGERVISTNTVEGFFSIFKRGMIGVYQHCSEKHLHRYLVEFDFRYTYRIKLGYNDTMRRDVALQGIPGKRLYYRRPREAEIPF